MFNLPLQLVHNTCKNIKKLEESERGPFSMGTGSLPERRGQKWVRNPPPPYPPTSCSYSSVILYIFHITARYRSIFPCGRMIDDRSTFIVDFQVQFGSISVSFSVFAREIDRISVVEFLKLNKNPPEMHQFCRSLSSVFGSSISF